MSLLEHLDRLGDRLEEQTKEQTEVLQKTVKDEVGVAVKAINANNNWNEISAQQDRSKNQHQTMSHLRTVIKYQDKSEQSALKLEKSTQKLQETSDEMREELGGVKRQLTQLMGLHNNLLTAVEGSNLNINVDSNANTNAKPCDTIQVVEDMTASTADSTSGSIDSFDAASEQTGKARLSLRNAAGASTSGLPPKTPSTATRRRARPPSSTKSRNEKAEENYKALRAKRLKADSVEKEMRM